MLAAGAVVGIVLGATGAFVPDGPDARALPNDTMAQVNNKDHQGRGIRPRYGAVCTRQT